MARNNKTVQKFWKKFSKTNFEKSITNNQFRKINLEKSISKNQLRKINYEK